MSVTATGRLRGELVRLAGELRPRGLTVSSCGNLSVRASGGMLITPTRRDPTDLRRRDIVRCSLDGRARRGTPSTEWPLHAAVYDARSEVTAIAHTHSPHAIARSFDLRPLLVDTEEAFYLGMPVVCVAPWRPAGSLELAAAAVAALADRPAVLLERHGVLAVGRTPREALEHAAAVELVAQVAHLVHATTTGGVVEVL